MTKEPHDIQSEHHSITANGTSIVYFWRDGIPCFTTADYEIDEQHESFPEQIKVMPSRRDRKGKVPPSNLPEDWLLMVRPDVDQRVLVEQLLALAASIKLIGLYVGTDRRGDYRRLKDGKVR